MVREGKSWSKWLYAPTRQRCVPPYSELLQIGYPSPRPKESASGPSTRNRGPPSALTPPAACPPVVRTASTNRPRTIARTPALAVTAPALRIERPHSPIAILRLQELLLEEASHTVFLTGMLENDVRRSLDVVDGVGHRHVHAAHLEHVEVVMPVAEHHALPGLEPEQVEQVAKAAAFADPGGLQGEAGLANHDRVVKEGAQPRVARTDLFGHGLHLEAGTVEREDGRIAAQASAQIGNIRGPIRPQGEDPRQRVGVGAHDELVNAVVHEAVPVGISVALQNLLGDVTGDAALDHRAPAAPEPRAIESHHGGAQAELLAIALGEVQELARGEADGSAQLLHGAQRGARASGELLRLRKKRAVEVEGDQSGSLDDRVTLGRWERD